MINKYTNDFRKTVVETVKIQKKSTSITAKEFNIPLKTLEKWITTYNKNNKCFDESDKNIKALEYEE